MVTGLEELLTRANPVLDPEELRLPASEADVRCASILERRGSMQTQTPTQVPMQEPTRPPRQRRTPALAFGLGLVVVLAALGGIAWLAGNDGPDVADQPATTTTVAPEATTTAPTATVAGAASDLAWEQVVAEAALEGTAWALAHNDDVVVAVGDDTRVMMGYLGPDDSPNVIVWTSRDGRTWDRIDDAAVFGGDGIEQAFKVSAAPSGFIISGEDDRNTVLWFSPDGYEWERTFDDDLGTPGTVESLTVLEGGPGWVALDDRLDPADPVFVSADGRNWEAASDDAYADELRRLFTEDRNREPTTTPQPEYPGIDWQYAWIGEQVVAHQYANYANLWTSPDAGETWNRVDPELPAFDVFPRPWLLAITQFHDLTIVAGDGIWIGWSP